MLGGKTKGNKEIEKVVSEKMGRSISQGPLGALKMHMNFNDLSLM